MPSQPRAAITLKQKKALRRQARHDGSLSNKELQAWFRNTYAREIAPSSVSEILSFRYDYVDAEHLTDQQMLKKKNRQQHWPELESLLARWMVEMMEDQDKAGNSGKGADEVQAKTLPNRVVRAQAVALWRQDPTNYGKSVPAFSNCWVQRFKARQSEILRYTARVSQDPVEVSWKEGSGDSSTSTFFDCDSGSEDLMWANDDITDTTWYTFDH